MCNFTVYCLLMICLLTDNCLFRSRTVELFGEKPDFNPFKNNNNQIEKSPKKQKENNMECKYEPKSKLFYFTAFPLLLTSEPKCNFDKIQNLQPPLNYNFLTLKRVATFRAATSWLQRHFCSPQR